MLLAIVVELALSSAPALVPGSDGGSVTPPSVEHKSFATVAREAGPAVVVLKTFNAEGAAIALGSGFFVDGGRIVTNAHVVAGASRVEVYDHQGELVGAVDYAEAASDTVDLAVLPAFKDAPGTLKLASALPDVGDELIVLGAPQGLSNTVSTGIVSAIRGEGSQRLIQMSAPISHGSSGGPVLNLSGEVVGISVLFVSEGQNLNFAVPVRNARALLGSPRGRFAFSKMNPLKEASAGPASDKETQQPAGQGEETKTRQALAAMPRLTPDEPTLIDFRKSKPRTGQNILAFAVSVQAGKKYTLVARSSGFGTELTAASVGADDKLVFLGTDRISLDGKDPQLVITPTFTGLMAVFLTPVDEENIGEARIGVFNGDLRAASGAETSHDSSTRWVEVGEANDASFKVDRLSVGKLQNGVVQAWVSVRPSSVRVEAGYSYDNEMMLEQFDCGGRHYRVVNTVLYLRGVQQIVDTNPTSWSTIVPESIAESTAAFACGR